MKSGSSPQKLRKYRWQTPIRASICTPVAPSLLISSGRSPRLGGTIFVWGGTSSHLGGHDLGMPPVAQGMFFCKQEERYCFGDTCQTGCETSN